ncbi:MAG: DUF4102 domain-containing protein [Synergistaceae bacterium]|nr:DUF4102 domain-containing protein [Synergistaceae bacterium]
MTLAYRLLKTNKIFSKSWLWLLVKPDGKKYWRLRYWVGDKERKISLGVYPTVGLKDARIKRDELFKIRDKGDDPAETLNAKKMHRICLLRI